MKKALLLILTGFILHFGYAQTGCPGCNIDLNCNIPGGGLCPDSLPGATYGQPYNQDVTFYLPNQVYVSQLGQNCPLLNLKINAISGLPFGLNWECNNTQNGCNYNPGQSNHGCVKICGTPIANPGIYNITVFSTGTVDAGIFGNQSGPQNFFFQMVVFPDTTNNSGFSMSPALGCAPLTVTFQNNYPSNGYVPIPSLTTGYNYHWDFGNGQQSNVENPPAVTYFTPGDYAINYQAIVDTFGFRLTELTLTSVNCTDPSGCPDPYIKIFDASNNLLFDNESNYFNNTCPPITIVFPNNGIPVTNPPLRIEVGDYDCCDPNDECYNNTNGSFPYLPLSLPPVNAFGATQLFFSNPNTSLTFNYKQVKNVFQLDVTDTVHVYPLPPATALTVSPSNAVCDRDSILLSVYQGYGYEWFYNDTVLLVNSTGNEHYATLPGKYHVRIFDLNTGCSILSGDTVLGFYPNIPTNFAISYNGNDGSMNSNINGNYTYQWLIWNGSGYVPIPGANTSSYVPIFNGQYALMATTSDGCTDTTDAFHYVYLGWIDNLEELTGLNIYPNPSSGYINIAFQKGWNSGYQVRIMDITGKLVYTSRQTDPQPGAILGVDLSNAGKGIYIAEILFEEGAIRQRIVIQ